MYSKEMLFRNKKAAINLVNSLNLIYNILNYYHYHFIFPEEGEMCEYCPK